MRAIIAPILSLLFIAFVAACSSGEATREMTAEERYHLGMEQYNDEDYLDALQEFEVIRLQFPGSTVSDSARYFSGMSHYKREEFLLASYEFNQVRQGAAGSGLLGDAQYMYAMSYVKLSPKEPLDQTYTVRAIDALQTFIELYPKHPKVKEAETYIKELFNKLAEKEYDTARLYLKLDNPESALIYFNNVIDKYYSTPYADDASYYRITILIRMKRTAQAEDAIKEFLTKYPDSPYREKVVELQDTVSLSSTK